MRALITGITGFFGSHLAEHLRAAGDVMLGTRRDFEAPTTFDLAVLDGIPIVDWDLALGAPHAATDRVLREFAPDVVFHLAAISVPRDCGADVPTPAAMKTNVDGVRHVVEFAARLPQRPRIVFASTSHVYAPVDGGGPRVAETSPIGPRNAYGKTKVAAEQILAAAFERGEADTIIARLFGQSGPRQDARLMFAEWAAQLVDPARRSIEVVSLDVTLDFLDVRDGVRALRGLAIGGVSGESYNVGSGVGRTSGELFSALQRIAGDSRNVVELRPGVRSDPIADVTKLVQATGWSPQISPEQTASDVLNEWRERRLR